MVSGARVEGYISPRVRKTIQSIKEIVGNHSDDDIYVALKEANMDPNETAQKLLHQDTFHVVRRKGDRKKESIGYQVTMDPRNHSENVGQGMKFRTYPERGSQRGVYTRNALPGVNREFRVVRDNRVNQNANKDTKPPFLQISTSGNEQVPMNVAEKGVLQVLYFLLPFCSSTGTPSNQRPRSSSQTSNAPFSSKLRHARVANSSGIDRKELEEKQTFIPNAVSRSLAVKPDYTQAHSATQSSSSSVVGVYSSSTDPVHVPSPDSRSSAAVGAIKREVGVVGVRRQRSENAVKDSTAASGSLSNSLVVRDTSSEAFRPFPAISRADQLSHNSATESVMPGISRSRSFMSNQYGSRQHQQVLGHQKANQHNKEWKPKSSQKSSANNPGVIGTPKKSASPPADDAKDMDSETAKLQDKFSQVNINENENVIIAQHIRVPENERRRLTFGSFGVEFDSSRNFVPDFQVTGVAEDSNGESAASLSVSAPKTSCHAAGGGNPIDTLDDQLRNSGSDSPPSGTASEHQLPDKKDTSSPQNLDSYADIGMIQDNSPSYAPSESQQQQDPPELPSFSQAYDPQTGYDFPYFRPPIDETARGQGLPSPLEALSMHAANIPASTIPMVQQQQPPVAQMYPQVHVSHFPNLMAYRQFVSPIYLPQMAMPGYSSNPAYPHPSNGSNYVLMPGGSSHLNANGLKYGIQQFKPLPAGSHGFGNFTSPSGYAINAPGVVGNATGLEDSSRIKYKDGNIYVQNQQADASDLWIQNPRELSGLQSAPYYNMPQTPHGYMQSHTGHASFSSAVPQSSHMQFSGLYHPPQPAAMANPHHLGPAIGANVGVGVASAASVAQVGAYQQPQLGHLNWTTNF
ncbi:uncharacterized protein LOC111280300 isoform X3 [Durio zibethinus]|uniref:Uncharacterized protein LOC111280300 isoform X3 n=1 Tax=Durio zibethinus TaxID=66656 RepID=A0A6P5X507_DURZI|nr:uncharacterized protein LOC111280300 isoform X3 [Durio zibethinus]